MRAPRVRGHARMSSRSFWGTSLPSRAFAWITRSRMAWGVYQSAHKEERAGDWTRFRGGFYGDENGDKIPWMRNLLNRISRPLYDAPKVFIREKGVLLSGQKKCAK